jgi:hypothetical protein
MKVVYTEEALRNLDDVSDYIRQNYLTISPRCIVAGGVAPAQPS